MRLDYLLPAETGQKKEASKLKQNPCPYRDGKVYMLESANASLKKAFNLSGSGLADVIHFADGRAHPAESNRFYGVWGRMNLPSGQRHGATRGLKIYSLSRFGAGEACWIDWVPTTQ